MSRKEDDARSTLHGLHRYQQVLQLWSPMRSSALVLGGVSSVHARLCRQHGHSEPVIPRKHFRFTGVEQRAHGCPRGTGMRTRRGRHYRCSGTHSDCASVHRATSSRRSKNDGVSHLPVARVRRRTPQVPVPTCTEKRRRVLEASSAHAFPQCAEGQGSDTPTPRRQ
jgi:hypothetical protein